MIFDQFPPVLRAIILMIFGMFFFMLGDLFLKLASAHLPLGMVVAFLGLGMTALFGVMMHRADESLFASHYWHGAMVMRCAGEAIGVIGVIIAVAYAPLSTVTAIMQSLPLVLTFMGAVLLKERVGIHRITALIMGLIGVLIIIRPGLDAFDFFASFTLIGVLGMAIRDFGTRIMPPEISTLALSFWGSVSIIFTGLVMMAFSQDWALPNQTGIIYCGALIVTAAIGTLSVSTAMRLGELGVISPFRYVRVVFGIGAGMIVFHESVDAPTYIGCLIVVLAGLYSWMREQKLAKAQNQTSA